MTWQIIVIDIILVALAIQYGQWQERRKKKYFEWECYHDECRISFNGTNEQVVRMLAVHHMEDSHREEYH